MTPTRRRRPIPTPRQACDGGLLAAANAAALLQAAIAAGGVRSFGAAEGIAILALEEALKARVLFVPLLADQLGSSLNVGEDQLKWLLHGPHAHFFRHAMGAWHVLSKRSREPSGVVDAIHAAPLTIEEFDAIDRFMMASHRKERGFYVDFTDAGWSTPASITEDRWLASRAFTEPFIAETTEQASQARVVLEGLA